MLVTWSSKLGSTSGAESTCTTIAIDQDIAGVGVRVALYGLGGTASGIALLGHFHGEISGVLELGLLLWLSLLTNLVNLVKSFFTATSPVNLLLAAMILDGYVSAISITLSMKDCLTIKWRLVSILFLQGLSVVAVATAIAMLPRLQVAQPSTEGSEDCRCFVTHWWGRVDTCQGASIAFWVYFSLRTLAWLYEVCVVVYYSRHYRGARKARDGEISTSKSVQRILACSLYDSVPATALSSYLVSMISFICSCISIELSLKAYRQDNTGLWKTWGQSAQIIALAWAAYRWVQQFAEMFTVASAKQRREILSKCSIGTLIPEIGHIHEIDKKLASWKYALLNLQQRWFNHPFGKLPPRRNSDHARFCSPDEGWRELKLDFRQWPLHTDDEKGAMLLSGAKQGDQVLVSNLLREDAPMDFVNSDGHSALRIAVDFDHLSIISKLLDHGADPNIPDVNGLSPLHVATRAGNESIVKLLLNKNASKHAVESGNAWTPLHAAARWGQLNIGRVLLDSGANPNMKDRKGRTPLHLLLRHGQAHMVNLFAGRSDTNIQDAKGKTAIYFAARYEREDAIADLLRHGADPTIACFNRGWTPLHVCSRFDRPRVAKRLLQMGCNPNIQDTVETKTALHWAAIYGREEVLDTLLHHNANLDLLDHKDRTALCLAAKDDRDATRKLLRKGADTTLGDSNWLKALLCRYGVSADEAENMVKENRRDDMLYVLK